jgi:hypothetical protein
VITIPIGPQSLSQDFLDGEGHVNFDLPGGLQAGNPFASTVTEVLNTGTSVEKSDLTFGDPNGLAMSASVSGGGAVMIELIWPQNTSEFAKAYGLTVPAGRVGARVHLEGQAGGKLSGGAPLPGGIAGFSFGLEAGSHVACDRYAEYDATMTSLALLEDLIKGLALPQRAGTPASVPTPGELLVFSYGGFLDLTAGLTCGYDLIGHQGLTLRDLDAAVEYGLRLKASVNVGYKFGGDFEISACQGGGPTWVRLRVKKARSSQFDFAAAFRAEAIAAVVGLPDSADDFLAALLGADVRRALDVFQKIRADSDLDTLRADVDRILLDSVTNLANKWLGRELDQQSLKAFQAAVGKAVDDYHAAGDDTVNIVVNLYQDYAGRGAVDTLTAALQKIATLSTRDDLANLNDPEAWAIVTRLSGGTPAALLQDDNAFDSVKAIAKAALNFVQGTWQPQLKDLADELQRRLHVNKLFGDLAGYATKEGLLRLTDTALQGVAERLLGMAWDKIKASDLGKAAADLHAALEQVNTFKDAWYAKLGDALHQSFSLKANATYTRATSADTLIDVEVDVSSPEGQKLFQFAAHGQFTGVFDRPNLRIVRVHQGKLTHELIESTHLQINVLQWDEKRLVDVMSRTTNSIEVQSTGLVNVFTTEASVTERIANKGYALESRFLVGLAGTASQTARRSQADDYLIRTLDRIGVTYNLAISNTVTSPAELTQYLDLAEYLRLIPSAPDFAATLGAQFPKGLDAVTATYVAKYSADAIFAAFSSASNAPLRGLVRQASRYLVSAHLINASSPQSDLVTMGFAYRDPANGALYDQAGFTGFRDANSTVTIPAWFTRGAAREVALPSGSFIRQQLVTLYGLETSIADGLTNLDQKIDLARNRHAAVAESDLETAARSFVDTAADINEYGTINTFFAIFDAFVQQGGGARPASTLILQITPAGSQTAVTKYLMTR